MRSLEGLIRVAVKHGQECAARMSEETTNGNIREKRIFRALGKNGTLSSESLSVAGIWKIVEQDAMHAGIGHLTPHDLRRICAKLCRANRGDLEQIQFLLGHSSIQTTERYLGGEQKVKKAGQMTGSSGL